jgi:hypothetical protein
VWSEAYLTTRIEGFCNYGGDGEVDPAPVLLVRFFAEQRDSSAIARIGHRDARQPTSLQEVCQLVLGMK